MGELEEAGFLEQPHTSAGRVPTDRGYRYFVDAILETPNASTDEWRKIQQFVQPHALEDVEQLMDRASLALAELAQQAGFVIAPTVKRSTVKQIELVPISLRKVLCVLIGQEEMVASHLVEVEEPMTRDELITLGRFLNAELVGLPFGALLDSLERRLLAEGDSFYHLVKRSLTILQHALATEPIDRLFVEGASYMLAQPEFSQHPTRTRAVLRHLEAHEAFVRCLREDISTEGLRVRIGHEIPLSGFEECSYLTAPFSIGEVIVGGVGILGPKRMDYRQMSALVRAMARLVTQLLNRWENA